MNITRSYVARITAAVTTVGVSSLLALGSTTLAAGGNGASPCSESGPITIGTHRFVDTFGHTVVAPTVQEGDGFSGDANPGQGFDWSYGEAGDGPVVPGFCNPNA